MPFDFQLPQRARLGFYFHVPFCPHICPYCDFTKTSKFSRSDVTAFFAALERQLAFFLNELKTHHYSKFFTTPKQAVTVYFGGGTPGLFAADLYEPLFLQLKNEFDLEEVTIETNPFTNNQAKLFSYQKMGFNRITLGAQSLCAQTLSLLGRKHTPQDVLQNLEWARAAGFENVQADLIYGLKAGVRTQRVRDEIHALVQAGASGISTYALSIEARTLFAVQAHLADDEVAVQEYEEIVETCAQLGLAQIETSNFSRFAAKHNNLYWHGLPYIGLGTGAHGLLPSTTDHSYGRRYKVGKETTVRAPGDDALVFQEPTQLESLFSIQYEPTRTRAQYLQEMIFTLLRTERGIPAAFLQEFLSGVNIQHALQTHPKIKRGLEEGKIVWDGSHVYLSPYEKIRGDAWALDFSDFIEYF